jgi:hypothetical protein
MCSTQSKKETYNHDAVRNAFLENGIKIFSDEEKEIFMKNYADYIKKIKKEIQHTLNLMGCNNFELCFDFLIACHYRCKELAEYLMLNYFVNSYIAYRAFIHCIMTENIIICEWLFSCKNIDYRKKQNFIGVNETYDDLFIQCCINGKLTSAKWMYEHGKINFGDVLLGVFLEKIFQNGHKNMLSWLFDEVKCTKNENLISTFRPVE